MMGNCTLMLLFSFIFIFCSGKFVSSSCIYKAVGASVEIPLGIGELQEESDLTWTHDHTWVYVKKGSNVKTHVFEAARNGSLLLENIQKKHSGEYEGKAYDKDGKFIMKSTHQLCVQEPVPKPRVIEESVENGVNLSCAPLNSSDVSVSWTRNGERFHTTHAVLHVSWSELTPGDVFSCTLTNMISTATAKGVEPVCPDTGLYATNTNEGKNRKKEENSEKEENSNTGNKGDDVPGKKLLFGFDFWWMLVILSGGASLLLVLFVLFLVGVCRCRSQHKRKAKEEAEFRLTSLMPDCTDQPDIQYMNTSSQRPSRSLRPLPALPGPRGPPALQPH